MALQWMTVALVSLSGGARAQETTCVSVASDGAQGNSSSVVPSISADGRFVVFQSQADNLVTGDTNGSVDVFIRDRLSGTTERVSIATDGTQGNYGSGTPSISADGRYVTFNSAASNLVNGDTNGYVDTFVHDRQGGTTERVSIATSGAQANTDCFASSISADGRYVVFASPANTLVSGETGWYWDVFVHDRQSGTTERVSVSTGGTQGNGDSGTWSPEISADGRYVAFGSAASNLVGGDTNGYEDVFVHDRQTKTTERVSVATDGTQGNWTCFGLSISADGRHVAFMSLSSNLVSGDTNGDGDIFVHDLQSNSTDRVSVATDGAQGNYRSESPSISADGRYISFQSTASNLVSGDTNWLRDIFVHDRQNGTTERASVATDGAEGDGDSFAPSISTDGDLTAFMSFSSNFVAGDTNFDFDVFVNERVIGTKYCTSNANSTGSPADLTASGSTSSGAGKLTFTSRPVPNQHGTFFHGTHQTQVPFGNGILCTNGGIVRSAVVTCTGNVANYTYDNSDANHSLAAFVGTTRNFQYWFRDPAGGGAFFNTSNAVSIVILP